MRDIKDNISLYIKSKYAGGDYAYRMVEFQFPPIIKSDTKSGNFTTIEANAGTFEPIKIYQGGSPRTITLETHYAIHEPTFTLEKIQKQLALMKSVFYCNIATESIVQDVIFQYGKYIKFLPVRITNFSVTPKGITTIDCSMGAYEEDYGLYSIAPAIFGVSITLESNIINDNMLGTRMKELMTENKEVKSEEKKKKSWWGNFWSEKEKLAPAPTETDADKKKDVATDESMIALPEIYKHIDWE